MFAYFFKISLFIILLWRTGAAETHRGFWVVRHTLANDQASELVVQTAQRIKATDVYVQVRALGKNFASEAPLTLQQDTSKRIRNFKKLISAAHSANIRVHAWINAFYIHSDYRNSVKAEHLFRSQPLYILRKASGGGIPTKEKLRSDRVEGHYIDPLNSKNSNEIIEIARYCIDSLNVDGIHLDYFRYPQNGYIYSPAGRKAFMLKYYSDPVVLEGGSSDMTLSQQMYLRRKYREFLEQNINSVLKRVRRATRYPRRVRLSVAVKPDSRVARQIYFQNWPGWINENLCDYVILMNYNKQDSVFLSNIEQIKSTFEAQRVVVGIATYNQTDWAVAERVKIINSSRFAGYNFFSYNDLQQKKTLLSLITNLESEKRPEINNRLELPQLLPNK